jgi:hypothetical protein
MAGKFHDENYAGELRQTEAGQGAGSELHETAFVGEFIRSGMRPTAVVEAISGNCAS